MKRIILPFILLTSFVYSSISVVAQETEKKEYYVSGIGFYNLENLFDTILDLDPNKILQDDFTPEGPKAWTSERYHEKLNNLARVISELGTEISPDGVAILGVSEVENKEVLEDLVKEEKIKSRNYQIVHHESPDRRGIDVGFLYNPNYFKVESSQTYALKMPNDSNFFTRDQLVVNGYLNGEMIHVIVAHWPSRSGGEKEVPQKEMLQEN